MDTISVSSALQIAGRAGRYGTQWEQVSHRFFIDNFSRSIHRFSEENLDIKKRTFRKC